MSRHKGKVLIIDDEPGLRKSLTLLLKDRYQVYCAEGVDAGLVLVKEERPDTIILDIRMPHKDGISGLGEIRELDKEVTVIMLTAYAALDTAQMAMKLGANEYIRKPFDTEEMLEAVQRNVKASRVNRKRAKAANELSCLRASVRNNIKHAEADDHMIALGIASSALVHDLRNPLTVIRGYVDLLAEEFQRFDRDADSQFSREAEVCLANIEHNLTRCRKLTDDWQDLGKTSHNGWQTLDLADLLRGMVTDINRFDNNATTRIQVSIPNSHYHVRGDFAQLLRAFENIVINALEAINSKNEGLVRIECGTQGAFVEVLIEDNGIGIDEEDLEWIFEPYGTKKGVGSGRGLGLFIAKTVVDMHKGAVKIKRSQSGGTAVAVVLPRKK